TEHDGLVAAFSGDVGMTHLRIEVDRFASLDDHGVVKLRVHFHAAFDYVNELFPGMLHEIAELPDAFRAYPRHERDHSLAAEFRAQVVVIVVPGIDAYRGVRGADTAARHDGGCRVVLRFREQLRHAEVEPLA